MKARKKQGPARMKELGKVKIEVWFTEGQKKEFAKLADEIGIPLATLARRACNYAARGGVGAMQALRGYGYD